MVRLNSISFMAVLVQLATCTPSTTGIPRGTFNVNQYQLYPENLDVSPFNGHIVFGCLFNSTATIFDPFRQAVVDIITLPGITHNPAQHVGGVRWDAVSNHLHILSDAGDAFNTNGQDISGSNILIKYDLDQHSELWRRNLTEVTGGLFGGFQDLALDDRGRAFVIGTYPGSILRINSDGRGLTTWWGPYTSNHSVDGLTGIAKFGNKFLAPDATSGKLYRFDMEDEKGRAVEVGQYPQLLGSDGIHLPPSYGSKLLLVAVHPSTTDSGIAVVQAWDDTWTTAEYLGHIDNEIDGSVITAAFSLGDQIYMLPEFFADGTGNAGNRTQFPMVDITEQIKALVKASKTRGIS